MYVSEEKMITYICKVYSLSPLWGMCAKSGQGLTIAGDYIKLGFNF